MVRGPDVCGQGTGAGADGAARFDNLSYIKDLAPEMGRSLRALYTVRF